MNDAINNAAPLTPTSAFLLSLAGGAGGYAGLKLLHDAMHKINKPKEYNSAVQLQLPDPMNASSPSVEAGSHTNIPQLNKAADWMAKSLAIGGGLPLGFLGAKSLYDNYQAHQTKQQIDEAKQKYMLALQQAQMANTKMANETPCVDGFCEELAKLAETPASTTNDVWAPGNEGLLAHIGNIPAHAVEAAATKAVQLAPGMFGYSNLAHPPAGMSQGDMWNRGASNPDLMRAAHDQIASNSHKGWNDAVNYVGGHAPDEAKKIWLALAAGAGLTAAGTGIHYYNKKKEREQKAQYPTAVEYAH